MYDCEVRKQAKGKHVKTNFSDCYLSDAFKNKTIHPCLLTTELQYKKHNMLETLKM